MREFLMRHQSTLKDASGFGALMIGAGILLFLFDLNGSLSLSPRIDRNELLILGAILISGLAWFGWRRIVAQEREIVATAKAEAHARFLAFHDPLTQLPNRRALHAALAATILHEPRRSGAHALLLFDLNGFKSINDVHGHGRGDDVLRVVGARIGRTMRDGDVFARMGGDEFALVIHNAPDAAAVAAIALKAQSTLASPIVLGTDSHLVGTGIGIALIPHDGTDAEELTRKADVALYVSKAQRPSPPVFFDVAMDRDAMDRASLQRDLAAAVAAQAIVPYYQPIVDLQTGEVRAFEALARWTHRGMGPIAPDCFIPMAEEIGLIGQLSDQLLKRACEDAVRWPSPIGLSFNIAPSQLRDATLGIRILGIMGSAGLALSRLELEISENAVQRDLEAASRVLAPLRDAGLRIVLDDFGAGATSLEHLRRFKFDGIKIDRHFVERMVQESESAAIVKTIVEFAKAMQLDVVAEGVEQQAQRAALRMEGCVTGQGFLFSRAVPAIETFHFFGQGPRAETG